MQSNGLQEWRSWAIQSWFLIILVLIQIATVALIGYLFFYSSSHSGFATVETLYAETLGVTWDKGLLWTTLPAFLFGIFALAWGALKDAVLERAPFEALGTPNGAPAKLSIMLDYRAVAAPKRWLTAFRNRHPLVGTTVLLSFFLSLLVASFSARLFATKIVVFGEQREMVLLTKFNDQAINASVDYGPIIEQVGAIKIFGGSPLPWTDNDYAFPQFTLDSSVKQKASISTTSTNLTLNTTGYSAQLDCQTITNYDLRFGASSSSSGKISISANDRGCSVSQDFDVTDLKETYFKATSTIDCSASSHYSRLVFTAGKYSRSSPNLLSNFTLTSCLTGYWTTSGALTIESGVDPTPAIRSFRPNSPPTLTPIALWRNFEQGILEPVTINPAVSWSTSSFGNLVLYHASRRNPSAYLSAEVLHSAIPEIFTSVYVTTAASHAFTASQNPEKVAGMKSSAVVRLFVVPWVAGFIIGFLLISLVITVWVFIHVRRVRSVLFEEPAGILSYAAMVHNSSQLLATVADVRQREDFDGKFLRRARQWWTLDEAICRMAPGNTRAVLEISGLRRKGDIPEDNEAYPMMGADGFFP